MAFSNDALLTSFMKVTTECSWTLSWYRSACLLLLRPLLCASFVPTKTVLRESPGPHSHSFDPILGLLVRIYFQTSVPVSSFPIYPLNHCLINVSQTLCWSLTWLSIVIYFNHLFRDLKSFINWIPFLKKDHLLLFPNRKLLSSWGYSHDPVNTAAFYFLIVSMYAFPTCRKSSSGLTCSHLTRRPSPASSWNPPRLLWLSQAYPSSER